jgi:2-polyprenyl-6-methoxyphenol hydroxylase-like FAD-dependent oxidoreductase
MNTGLQDSMSLAGALASTLKDGDTVRLDGWAAERHRVASNVVTFFTDRTTRMATIKTNTGKVLRNAAIAFAGRFPQIRSSLAKNLAELKDR